jgi:hypothetical protein
VEVRGGAVALVAVLVVGGAVWVFSTSPGYALVALLAGLVLWEYGRRSRYRRRLRFVPTPTRTRTRGRTRARPVATTTPPARPVQAARPARTPALGRRPLWNRTPAWKTPHRTFESSPHRSPARPRPVPRAAPPRRP